MKKCPRCKKELTELEEWAGYKNCAQCEDLRLICDECGRTINGNGYEVDDKLICEKCIEEYEGVY